MAVGNRCFLSIAFMPQHCSTCTRCPPSRLNEIIPPAGTHYINRIFPGYNPAAGVYPNWGIVRVINGAILTVDGWDRDTGAGDS